MNKTDRKYRKEKARFYQEIAAGRTPELCPVLTTYEGRTIVDGNDLIRSAGFKRTTEAIRAKIVLSET